MSGANSKFGEINDLDVSYWRRKGYTDDFIQDAIKLIQELVRISDKLANNNFLKVRLDMGRRNWNISFDDIFYPYWQRFSNVLHECNPRIHRFSITGIQLPKKILDILTPAVPKNNLRWLELRQNNVGRGGILFMSNILRMCPSLEKLWLICNEINDFDAVSQLSQDLSGHNRLEDLRLSCCGLGNDTEILSTILTGARNLRRVSLDDNQIDLLGSTNISNLLAENPDIEFMDLSYNRLDDAAAICLADALKKNNNLKFLNLRGNYDINKAGIMRICDTIFGRSSLNAIADSNHACVLDISYSDAAVFSSLKLNRNETTEENMINKLFLALRDDEEGVLSLHYFNEVQWKLMPNVFVLLQNDPNQGKLLSNIFDLLRFKMPLLFDCNMTATN